MKKTSIYSDRSQELLALFEKAGNPSKLMCVPIDYAKKQRENLQASTDRLDPMGIATMLLNRRANCCPAQTGVYRNLRTLVRHRKKLVKMKTEVRNRIHTIVDRLFCLFEGAQQLANEMAELLAKTQGAFITRIEGIGIVLAAGVSGEIGDPLAQRSTDQLASYAGIVPKVKQTGGSLGPSITGHVSKRSNHILKDFVVQSAFHIGRYGPKDLQDDFSRREATGQHADFGIARRLVRITMCMMRTSQIYLPPDMKNTHIKPEQRADYYRSIWPYLRDKWGKAGALKMAFAKSNPLGQWRYIVQAIYGIKLKM